MAETRKQYSALIKARAVAYGREHGFDEAAKKYGVAAGSMVGRWARLNGAADAHPKEKEASRQASRRNRALDATVLLRKAMQMVETEVRAGAPFRESDALVRLALAELTTIKRTDDDE